MVARMAMVGLTELAPLMAFSPANVALDLLQSSPLQKHVSVARTPKTLVCEQSPAASLVPPQSYVGI